MLFYLGAFCENNKRIIWVYENPAKYQKADSAF